jgi:tetratricopeptide (TPR) repeat protein
MQRLSLCSERPLEADRRCLEIGDMYDLWAALELLVNRDAQRMEQVAQGLAGSSIDTLWVAPLHHHREDFHNAIRWYLKARDLGYGFGAKLNAAIATYYISLGDLGAAREYLDWARKHDPGDEYVEDVQREYGRHLAMKTIGYPAEERVGMSSSKRRLLFFSAALLHHRDGNVDLLHDKQARSMAASLIYSVRPVPPSQWPSPFGFPRLC